MKTLTILPKHYKTYVRFVSYFIVTFRNPKYVTGPWMLGGKQPKKSIPMYCTIIQRLKKKVSHCCLLCGKPQDWVGGREN